MARIVGLISLFVIFSPFSYAANRIVQNTSNSGTGSFREAVEGAADGDTVRFDPGLIANGSTTIVLLSEVTLKKGIVIKGLYTDKDTLYLSGNNTNRILNVTLDSASVKSLTLDSMVMIHGYGGIGTGGAVSVNMATDVNLFNSRLYHNESNGGGALFVGSKGLVTLTIRNSLLDSNSAPNGGAVSLYGTQMSGILIVENSVIENNKASDNGGGVYCYISDSCILTLVNTSVSGNYSLKSGAGIYSSSYYFRNQIKIDSCQLENNYSYLGEGGAIYCNSQSSYATISSSVSISNSLVRGNETHYKGGGIYCFSTRESSVELINSVLADNSADRCSNCIGGGIYSNSYSHASSVTVTKSSVTGNRAGEGAGIYSYSSAGSSSYPSSVTIANSTIANNEAISIYGGGIYSYGSTFSASIVTISNSTLVNNYAQYYGSALYAYGRSFSTISITNSTVANNTEYFVNEAVNNSSPNSAVIEVKGSIFLHNSKNFVNKRSTSNVNIKSNGYNIFSDAPAGNTSLDMVNANQTSIKLGPLANNGGPTLTMVPLAGSIAIDEGDSADHSPAQNGSFSGIRDIGAAESCISAITRNVSACYQYVYKGVPYTTNEVFYDSLVSQLGCDSIITTRLTIFHADSLEQTISACDSFVIGSETYFTSGTYSDTLSTSAGCDSFVTTYLTILPSASSIQNVTACFYAVINGKTYTTSQKIVDRLSGMASNGCDSVVTTNLTINKIDIGTTVNGDTLGSKESSATYQWLDCANALAPIPNETGRFFVPTKSGNYAVEVTLNNCVDTSICVQFIRTGEPDLLLNGGFQIYPNPGNGHFTLVFGRLQPDITVTITTVAGQVISSQRFSNIHEATLNISGEAGLYFVEIGDGSGARFLTRIVKMN